MIATRFPVAVIMREPVVLEAFVPRDDGVIIAARDAIVGRSDRGNDERSESTENHDCLLENEHDDLISCFQRNPLMGEQRATGMPRRDPRIASSPARDAPGVHTWREILKKP